MLYRAFFLPTILSVILSFQMQLTSAATAPSGTFGNAYNFFTASSSGVDLTRGKNTSGGISIKTNDDSGKSPILIDPASSALVIIDMQNYFLHPALSKSSLGRDLVPTQTALIKSMRASGIKILWVQWGLTEHDLITMTPALLYNFGSGKANATMGTEMGTVKTTDANGTVVEIDMGRKLMRGSWNTEAWGSLLPLQQEGIEAGTDFYFNKNRLSGMWGASTPMQMFLEDQGITTLFFGGVNTDQCVWGTLIDAMYKGYDTILVPDIAATSSPSSVNAMVYYNAQGVGWVTNSTEILSALSS